MCEHTKESLCVSTSERVCMSVNSKTPSEMISVKKVQCRNALAVWVCLSCILFFLVALTLVGSIKM